MADQPDAWQEQGEDRRGGQGLKLKLGQRVANPRRPGACIKEVAQSVNGGLTEIPRKFRLAGDFAFPERASPGGDAVAARRHAERWPNFAKLASMNA
ncbi:hypothetical protein FCJ59_11560 [Cupriavidus basilensis]|nr:hypothetical protein [Cupriavidus basilensis]